MRGLPSSKHPKITDLNITQIQPQDSKIADLSTLLEKYKERLLKKDAKVCEIRNNLSKFASIRQELVIDTPELFTTDYTYCFGKKNGGISRKRNIKFPSVVEQSTKDQTLAKRDPYLDLQRRRKAKILEDCRFD